VPLLANLGRYKRPRRRIGDIRFLPRLRVVEDANQRNSGCRMTLAVLSGSMGWRLGRCATVARGLSSRSSWWVVQRVVRGAAGGR
jgi:hypothetical protein